MSHKRLSTGRHGEKLAADYLIKKGFQLLARNYRCRLGEIDLIAKDKNTIVFVEVKTRTTVTFGQPYEAVTARKQAQLTKVSLDFINRNKLFDKAARFDIISIIISDYGKPAIEHLENCFEPSFPYN